MESKEIESHYVLAREPIQKWNSSSDCYLLIEGVEHTLQVNIDLIWFARLKRELCTSIYIKHKISRHAKIDDCGNVIAEQKPFEMQHRRR